MKYKNWKRKKSSKKQIKSWEKEDYDYFLRHPAIELLRLLPHTKTYKLMCLLDEVLNETFDSGYDAGMSDYEIIKERME